MNDPSPIRRTWRTMLRRSDVRRAVSEELAFHIEMTARDLETLEGIPSEAARDEAERRFGHYRYYQRQCQRIGERRRKARMRILRLHDLKADLFYAIRTLTRVPFVIIVTVISLGLGIGAATTIFSMANALLYRPASWLGEPEELVTIYTSSDEGNQHGPISYPDYEDIRSQVDALEGVTLFGFDAMTMGEAASTQIVLAEVVSGNYFEVLQFQPTLGRSFAPEETEPGSAEPIAVISYERWKNDFGSDPSAIGRTIRLNGKLFTVIGVAPPGTSSRLMALKTDLWIPMGIPGAGTRRRLQDLDERGDRDFSVMGRLEEGSSIDQVQIQLDVLAERLNQSYPEAWVDHLGETRSMTVVSERKSRVNPDARIGLSAITIFLMGATGLILLIACSNVASLFLARATRRRPEMAIRVSLGASRRRLVAMLLIESLLLGLMSGVVGAIFASVVIQMLSSISIPVGLPINFAIALDYRVLGFTLLLSICASIVFGLAPALEGANPSPITSLKGDVDVIGRRRRKGGLRNFLVVAQIAGSLVFVAGAGLFLRSLQGAVQLDLGFNADRIAIMSRGLAEEEFGPEVGSGFIRNLKTRLEVAPSVEEVAISRVAELTLLNATTHADVQAGPGVERPEDLITYYYNSVAPGYLEMLEVPLLSGRTIQEGDVDGTLPVAVINETFADRFWPGDDPIGKQFTMHKREETGDERGTSAIQLQVVGVTRDGLYLEIDEGPTPYFWTSIYQTYSPILTVLVKGRNSAEEMIPILEREVPSRDNQLALVTVTTLTSLIDMQYIHLRIASRVLSWGGLLGLMLAVIGVYGIVAFAISLRSREMAIRIAIGAQRSQVLRAVMRDGVKLIVIGLAIGLVLIVPLAIAIRSQLYGMSPIDPLALGGSTGILFTAALTACLIPAWKAVRGDPMGVLREE